MAGPVECSNEQHHLVLVNDYRAGAGCCCAGNGVAKAAAMVPIAETMGSIVGISARVLRRSPERGQARDVDVDGLPHLFAQVPPWDWTRRPTRRSGLRIPGPTRLQSL